MPVELLSEQLVLFLLIMVGGLVVSSGVAVISAELEAQARIVSQEKLSYFFSLVGYSWLDRVNTTVAPPVGTAWIEASATTLKMDVNGTTYVENYFFDVSSPNTTSPQCLLIEPTTLGVSISYVDGVNCVWRAS